MNGYGKLHYDDGAVYIGEFLDGLPHGKGMICTPDGEKRIGKWRKGKNRMSSFPGIAVNPGRVFNYNMSKRNISKISFLKREERIFV